MSTFKNFSPVVSAECFFKYTSDFKFTLRLRCVKRAESQPISYWNPRSDQIAVNSMMTNKKRPAIFIWMADS